MVNLYNDSETTLDVRHAGGVAYVLQPGLNVDVPDVLASFGCGGTRPTPPGT